MISLAFWATVINYLDRQTLSVAAPVLRDQFHMSNVDYSRVVFAFMLAYTIMNGVSGPLIDRLGTRLGYGLCIAWWSIAAMLHALSRGALSLGVYRFLLGMGEAGNWPGAVKVVAEWFPERERALAAGLFNSGSAVGAILAPPIVAFLLLKWGWQSAFLFVGTAGLVWLAFWGRMYRTPAAPEGGASVPVVPLGVLLRSRFVWTFTISKIFMDPVWYFYIFWFPEYLKRVRNFDLAAIGKFAWIPFLVAGFGNLLGGWLSGFLLQRGVSVAMLGYTGSLANMLTFPADVFPGNAVASVFGLASMGAGFGGMVFTLITGWVVDRYSYTPVFIGFGILPLVCAAILWAFLGPLRPQKLA
jgi:ACS family hexuronate transporter-like MFS transporter